MLLGTLILLLLSYSITSRRDKSIFHSRAMMTILLSIIVNLSYFILIFVFLMVLVPNLVTILFSFALTVMKTMISNLSPIQLIDQLKGYYYINPIIALSLGITLFSFAGIPPLIGFFGKQMILNQIQSYLGKLCTFLFNKYPGLYKAMDYFFTTLSVFNLYFYSIVFKLHDRFKNNYPIFYNILLYFYSEYLSILKGNLSRNMGYVISFYVLYD